MIMQMCIFWVNMNYETREAPMMFQDSEPQRTRGDLRDEKG